MKFCKMKKRLAALTAVLLVSFLSFSTLATPTQVHAAFKSEYEPHCDTVYMMNMDTGTVVFEKNPDKKKLPASLTITKRR